MPKVGKYSDAERTYLEQLAARINANQLTFSAGVKEAVAELDRSEKGVALYMGRITRRAAGGGSRRRRPGRMPRADAKAGELVKAIQSLSHEHKKLASQRRDLDRKLDDVEGRLTVLRDRLLKNLGVPD